MHARAQNGAFDLSGIPARAALAFVVGKAMSRIALDLDALRVAHLQPELYVHARPSAADAELQPGRNVADLFAGRLDHSMQGCV